MQDKENGQGTASAQRRPSRLIGKLAALFLLFVAVGVALNCALTFVNTRDTYLEAQSARLHQVGSYAVDSARANSDLAALCQTWRELGEGLLDAGDLEQAQAAADEAYASYQATYEEVAAKYSASAASEMDEADTALLDESYAAYERASSAASYYSLAAMLGRLRQTFQVQGVSLLIPDPISGAVTYVADGGDGNAPGGRAFGDVEVRDDAGYPALWEAVAGAGGSSATLSRSPDGALYLSYVPFAVGDSTWVFELSMSTAAFNSALVQQMLGALLISCAVFALCLVSMLLVLRQTLVRPIEDLSGSVRTYARDKDACVAAQIRARCLPRDEVGELAVNVADMVDEIQRHVEEVGRMSAERERVASELAVAHRIQLSALPRVEAPFTGQTGAFFLFASMNPAKEVGGDFYDFFMVDEGHCAVLIADVSGKGVPAALFMMRAKALLRQLLAEGLAPAEAMARANDGLAAENDENMFVTVWLGVLDVHTGELAFSNGGHNPPVLRHADGAVEWLRKRSGVLVGGFAGVPYRGHSLQMAPGDTLLLYTDGVTEAMDVRGACYGESRLQALLESLPNQAPEELVHAVEADVRAYAGQAEQADDITLLALKFGVGQAVCDGGLC